MLPLDNTIKYHHLLLKIELNDIKKYDLPEDYEFVFYKDGDEKDWINIELSAQEFIEYEEGINAWNEYYTNNKKDLYNRLIFIVDKKSKEKIATVTSYYNTWTNNKNEAYLHWVAIKKEYQGLKLARPLISFALNNLKALGYKEAFISTQTTTWLAAKLYLDFDAYPYDLNKELTGFQILKGIIGNHDKLMSVQPITSIYDETLLKIKNILLNKHKTIDAFKVITKGNQLIVKIMCFDKLYKYYVDLKQNIEYDNFICLDS